MLRLRGIRAGMVIAVMAVVATGCGSSKSSSSSTTAAAASSSTTVATATTAAPATTAASLGATPKATVGFDGTTINLGMLAALSGPVAAPIGIPIANGNRVFFEALNKQGGIAGKYKVNLVEGDTKYDVAETVKQYGATKDKVVAYVQVIGTPMVQALLQSLNEDHILVQPATLDSIWQKEKYLIPILGPYQIQAINALSYWVQQNGKSTNVCAMTILSAYGQAGLDGVNYAASQLGITIKSNQTHKQGDQDFTAQINALRDAKCDMVWLTALPTETALILGRAAQSGFTPQWIGQSPTWVGAFLGLPIAPYLKAHFWLASEGQQWGDTSIPGMVAMLDAIKSSSIDPNQKPDTYFGFGYEEASAIAQVLTQAVKDGDLSHDGIVKAVKDLGTLTFGGLVADQKVGDPGVRDASRSTTLFKVTPETAAVDGGLTPVVKLYESDAAKSFKF